MHKPVARSAIQILLRPDVLFTIATLQGLSPYLFWPFGAGAAVPSSDLSYIPLIISLAGWLAFLFGASLVWAPTTSEVKFRFSPHQNRIKRLLWMGLLTGSIEVYLTVKVYGAVPMLSYIGGDGDLDAARAADLQEGSFIGQIALITLTVVLLGAILLALATIAIEKKKKVTAAFYVGLIGSVLLSLFNAKRIGMIRIFGLLLSGVLMYDQRALTNMSALIPLVKGKRAAVFALVGLLFTQYAIFGPIAQLRNPGALQTSSYLQVVSYQEDVILNMEEQTNKAGYGPYKFSLLAPFDGFLPRKLSPDIPLDQRPPKVDFSSPNGFYELLHWYWGPVGCLVFPAMMGALCMWLYRRMRSGAAYFFCYSYIVASLLLTHTFNEFLIAPTVLIPWLCFVLMARWLSVPAEKADAVASGQKLRPLRVRRSIRSSIAA